jgi:hypothetical protein
MDTFEPVGKRRNLPHRANPLGGRTAQPVKAIFLLLRVMAGKFANGDFFQFDLLFVPM